MEEKLKVGDAAPDFTLRDQHGRDVSLSDYRGRKVLVYFYPKADTPGCTAQSCSLRDNLPQFQVLGIDVLGLSPDEVEDQLAFDQKFSLGFPLLADSDHRVAEAWGTWGERSMYGNTFMGIVRSSFLVDEKGSIQEAWYKVSPADTVPNALKALAAA